MNTFSSRLTSASAFFPESLHAVPDQPQQHLWSWFLQTLITQPVKTTHWDLTFSWSISNWGGMDPAGRTTLPTIG